MGKWGRADFKQLKALQENIDQLAQKMNMDAFCEQCCKALAARLLALVIPATPVGKYPKSSGKMGGTLRRGWGIDTAAEAKAYVDSLAIQKSGSGYLMEIINPVEYASWVEFGHRTPDHKGWVEGRFMLTASEDALKTVAPKILERMLLAHLKEAFNVRG